MANFLDDHAPLNSDADILPSAGSSTLSRPWPAASLFLTLIAILLKHEFGQLPLPCPRRAPLPALPAPGPFAQWQLWSGHSASFTRRIPRSPVEQGRDGPNLRTHPCNRNQRPGFSLSHCGFTTLTGNIHTPLIVGVLLGGLTIVPSSLPSSSRILFWSRTGWGILITAINLIPSGQLDGGHILCAISLKSHPFCTQIVVVVLFVLCLLFWVSCILWAAILLIPGMRHPSVASSEKLRGWRLALVPECGSILVLTFTFAPSRATARFR